MRVERIQELLLQWEEEYERGRDIPAKELCRDEPELVGSVQAGIQALKEMNWLDKRVSPWTYIWWSYSDFTMRRRPLATDVYRHRDLVAKNLRMYIHASRTFRCPLPRVTPTRVQSGNDDSHLAPNEHLSLPSHPPSSGVQWVTFDWAVDALPSRERAVFDLLWYLGMSRELATEVLGLSIVTMKRRWQRTRLLLHHFMKCLSPTNGESANE